MKRKIILVVVVLICFVCSLLVFEKRPSMRKAQKRIEEFTHTVNYLYDTPEKIYDYMTADYKRSITEDKFVEAFIKERSYPYLTTFFINLESVEISDDKSHGVAKYSQAARLPGMWVDIEFVYENGDYYFIVEKYAGFPDGSYLKKFDSIPNYLINGWD